MRKNIVIDIFLFIFSYYFSFVLRFSSFTFTQEFETFIKTLPIVLVIKLALFSYFGTHKIIWRYASIYDLNNILKASVLSTLVIIFSIFSFFRIGYPRSVVAIDFLLTTFFIGGVRFLSRIKSEIYIHSTYGKRVLIVGGGEAGRMILKEIKSNPKIGYNPVGIIDDDAKKQGISIYGIPVIGTHKDIPYLVKKYMINEVIIAIPSASGDDMRKIVEQCRISGVKFKTLPALAHIIDGTVSLSQIKEVDVSDLLRREPIQLDIDRISSHIGGKKIMVTGAAGSIGSELCFQIAKFLPKELILVDIAESPLYLTQRKLVDSFPNLNISYYLMDVTNYSFMEKLISTHKPQIIYHAAAYKHVPVLESNVLVGINNNVFGTKVVAELSKKYKVNEFVLVSTDKAVNPKSIMGISKRICELYIKSLANDSSQTKFISVRFGNVLDSSGSCLPIFKEQIMKNQPITITHKEAKRYFMTLPEATQLILQASAIGNGGEIFILKMGELIKIVDLVNDLLWFSGLSPDKVEIKYTGLRPGEKLVEELIGKDETIQLTHQDKIFIVNSNNNVSNSELEKELKELKSLIDAGDERLVIEKCKSIISLG